MKVTALIPHTHCFGGIRRWIELGNIYADYDDIDYEIISLGNSKIDWMENKSVIKRCTPETIKTDIIIFGDPATGLETIAKKAIAKKKIVYIIAGGNFLENYRWLMADGSDFEYIVNNEKFKDLFPECDNLRVFPGGINTDFFKYKPRKYKNDILNVICYGRGMIKGVDIVYRTLYDIKNINLLFFIDETKSGILNLFHDANTKIIRSQQELLDLYYWADIYCAYERRLGWGNCAIEAMACGNFLLTNGVGTNHFANEKTAIINNNPRIALEQFRQLSTVARCRMQINIQEHIRHFTYKKLAKDLYDYFHEI